MFSSGVETFRIAINMDFSSNVCLLFGTIDGELLRSHLQPSVVWE